MQSRRARVSSLWLQREAGAGQHSQLRCRTLHPRVYAKSAFRRGLLTSAGLVALFFLSATILVGIPQEGPFRARHVRDALEVALHVSISPFGLVVMNPQGLIGTAVPWLSFALIAFAFLLSVKPVVHYARSFRSTNATRGRALPSRWPASQADFLVVGFSIIALMVAIGVGRGGRGWDSGLEMHYGGVALPLIFWSYLSLVLSWRYRYVPIAAGLLALIFLWSYWLSLAMAESGARFQTGRRAALERDLKAGKPLDEIINRNIGYLYWVDTGGTRGNIRSGLVLLKAEAVRDRNRRSALRPYLAITDIVR